MLAELLKFSPNIPNQLHSETQKGREFTKLNAVHVYLRKVKVTCIASRLTTAEEITLNKYSRLE
jgi:hypothetical protein